MCPPKQSIPVKKNTFAQCRLPKGLGKRDVMIIREAWIQSVSEYLEVRKGIQYALKIWRKGSIWR